MKADEIPITNTDNAIIKAVLWKKMLAIAATSTMIMPMNKNLPMDDRSRLMTLDSVAMPKKIPPVPAKAVMIKLAPLLRPKILPTRRDSIKPIKKVNANKIGTPAAEFLNFSMANMKPKAPPMKTIKPIQGDIVAMAAPTPVATPIQAPKMVGTMDKDSSQ